MLTNPTPITTEPTPAKVFDKLHVYTLSAIQPTTDSGSITVELLPATSEGELANGSFVQRISAPLNPEIMQAVPELAAAFQAVLAAIPATQEWVNQQNQQNEQNLQNEQNQQNEQNEQNQQNETNENPTESN